MNLTTRNAGLIFSHVVEKYPDRIALIEDDGFQVRKVTYSDFDVSINNFSGWLTSRGIGKEDQILALFHNRLECVQVILGAARAGASTMILSPFVGKTILQELISESRCSAAFIDPKCPDEIAQVIESAGIDMCTTTATDDDQSSTLAEALKRQATTYPAHHLSDGHPCVVLTTSGSTGKPKKLVKTHGHFLFRHTNPTIRPEGSSLISMPLYHISGLNQTITGVLAHGRTGVLLPNSSPKRFLTSLATHRCVTAIAVPTQLAACLRQTELVDALDFISLKLLVVTGAPSPTKLLEKLASAFPHARIANAYGLTECPGGFGPDPDGAPTPTGSIGKTQADFESKLMSEDGIESDVGELWIRSRWIAAGNVWADREKYQRFEGDWLKTGDVFRRDKKGWLYYVDRIDDMFTCGAENVYPAEVEGILSSHSEISEACVIALPDELMGKVPAAAVVLESGSTLTEEQVMEFYRSNGSQSSCPRIIEIMNNLPSLPAGKIDRQAIKATLKSRVTMQQCAARPNIAKDDLEQLISRVWKEALMIKDLERTDDFFDLGGDSIRATQIAGKLRSSLDIPVDIVDLFQHSNVADLAEYLTGRH